MTDWLKELNALTDDYYRWLRGKTDIIPADGGWAVIASPFLGAFNDAIEIYARREDNGKITLSDDGETLHNLKLQGCDICGSKRRVEIADTIVRTHGVSLDWGKGELRAEVAKKSDFPAKKHDLLSAILEVNDMVVLARPSVRRLFKEDVAEYLDGLEIISAPQFGCRGSSGIHFSFDFLISGKKEEIVVNAFSKIDKPKTVQFLYGLKDIRGLREKQSRKKLSSVVVINDDWHDSEIGGARGRPALAPAQEKYINAIESEGYSCILWSDRDKPESVEKFNLAA